MLRTHWPATAITIRGDSHDDRHEVMTISESIHKRFVFGLAGNDMFTDLVDASANRIDIERALENEETWRDFIEPRSVGKSWLDADHRPVERHACNRIEDTRRGLDTRFVATNTTTCDQRTLSNISPPSRTGSPDVDFMAERSGFEPQAETTGFGRCRLNQSFKSLAIMSVWEVPNFYL